MTNSFITYNCACQKFKGTDYAREVFKQYLRHHYRKFGLTGGVLHIDIKGYFPNMQHNVAKDKFKKYLDPDVYKMAEQILDEQYDGDVGYNPGSQMIQIAGISVPDEIDHYIKEVLHIKGYVRYVDDFMLIHDNIEYLEYCKEKICEKLKEIGFEPNTKKTKVIPINDDILFLGFVYRIQRYGKVTMTLNSDNVKKEKKKLCRLVNKSKKGKIPKSKVDECYFGWREHASKGNSRQLIRRMDLYYKTLWEEL